MQDAVRAAREYKRRGWNPLPLRPGEKRPTGSEWQRTQIADDQIEQRFQNMNVGVALGSQSGNLYDADLDHELVVKLYPRFARGLETPAIFGRPGKPLSHWIYQAPAAEQVRRISFVDVDNTMLAEIRGDGHQTMFPPSIHPSGDPIAWIDPDALPLHASIQKVAHALGWCSGAVMLIRGWDSWDDQHHILTGALAGGFARSGIGVNLAENFVRCVSLYAGDHEPDDRVRMVRDTYAQFEQDPDAPVTGFPTLREIIGVDRVTRLTRWLQLKKPQDDNRPTLTDDGNALRFVETHGDQIRYVHEHKKWYVWDGSRWSNDSQENIVALAREIPRTLLRTAADEIDDELRKKLTSWATNSHSITRITAMHTLARSDDRVKIPSDLLDADPWSFNVQNGTINLRTGGIAPHEKNDLITNLVPITFNPRAVSPLWHDYLKLVFRDDAELIEFVQRCVGYSMTGLTNEQVFFILHGPQGTGKTTFIETLRKIFGDYARNADPSTFMQKQKTGRANPEIARLQTARFVTSSETEENERLAAGLVKRLSGSTRITASHLYAEDFEYEPVMKLWIDTNHKPRIAAHDDAVWARLILIPFDVIIRHTSQDIKGFRDILATELPGILRWAVEGCLKWQQDGLARPNKIDEAAQEYRNDSDTIQQFIDDECIVDPRAVCGIQELHVAYKRWCEDAGIRNLNRTAFNQRMQEHGFLKDDHDTSRPKWIGIRPAGSQAENLNRKQENVMDGPTRPVA